MEIRCWLKTFNVQLASEGTVRNLAKEWVGKGIRSEYAPLLVKVSDKRVIKNVPWCYVFNLVGHILDRLNKLKECDLIRKHYFIPDNEVHIKIGGDHGGGSFKMAYQVPNVNHPNRIDNTVIFSIFEAKDTISTLRMCLERFKAHVNKLTSVTWNEKSIRCFMLGDYEFSTNMYGLSGASGKHPCLWCEITADDMQVPLFVRQNIPCNKRSLANLKENYKRFLDDHQGNIKHAKMIKNVICDVFF